MRSDDPGRFKSSKAVGALFGLTPKKYPILCINPFIDLSGIANANPTDIGTDLGSGRVRA